LSLKAVLLAAGKGTRLGALTAAQPKPMLPVGGRPVVDHLLDLLTDAGVTEAYINLHHAPATLQEHCGTGARWGIRIEYAIEPELLGTAGAVRNFARHLADAPFFVVYGDNYLETDLGALWRFHHARKAVASIGLFEKDDVTGSGIVEIDSQGRVLRFVEKPRPAEVFSRLVNGGLYVLSPDVLPLISDRVPCDFGYDVFPALVEAGRPVYGRRMEGRVGALDTPELYRELAAQVERGA
jgi:NDP-sugar pyrophosphorylase family protein